MAGNKSFGNLAYDFRTRDTYTPETYSAGKRAAEKKTTAAKRVARPLSSPLAMVGGVLAAVMLCCSLLAQAQLSAVANETVAVQDRIEQLRREQARLEIEHARAFGLEELESYAIEVLGMQRPGADQIIYTDSSDEVDLSGE